MSPLRDPAQKVLAPLDATTESGTWECVSADASASAPRASGWVKRADLDRDEEIDPTDGLGHVARELQIELREELLETFGRLVARRQAAQRDAARGPDAGVIIAWTSSRAS